MRVLFALRPDAETRHGGDVVLARSTAAALRDQGHYVVMMASADFDAQGFDVVHVFTIFEPDVCARQIDAAERARARIALSGIWMDRTEFASKAPQCERALAERSDRALARIAAVRQQAPGQGLGPRDRVRVATIVQRQAACAKRAHVLLPNSAMAARECALHLGVPHIPFVVVPVAVDLEPAPAWTAQRREGVACVGRIESLKNQAMLAFALREQRHMLALIGLAYDSYYEELCSRWGGPSVIITGHLERERKLEILSTTAVHALPSWGDLPGLASLEAALAGAQIVVGNRGSEMEYFEDDAEYADPCDPDSIAGAIERAMSRPRRRPGDSLDRRMRALTWKRAAEATVRGYELAMGIR